MWTLENDQKITQTNIYHWTWPKTNEYDRKSINEINSLRRQTWTGEYDRKKLYFLISVIFTRYCSPLSYILGHVQRDNVCRCDLFGHVQIFWSYSFSHLESVKWVLLFYFGQIWLFLHNIFQSVEWPSSGKFIEWMNYF